MKKSKAERFFTEEERERIKEATRDTESGTIGEIAVMVVDSSDQYAEAEVIGGIMLGGLVSLITTVLFFHSSVWSYIPMSFLLFFPSLLLLRKVPSFKPAFIGKKRMQEAVRQRAVRAFFEKGLYKTKDNTGVLFFLSLLERKVWVLADKGIHEKIEQKTLNRFAKTVSQVVKDGRSCDALCGAIKETGLLLAGHFPIAPGDTNELSDDLITE